MGERQPQVVTVRIETNLVWNVVHEDGGPWMGVCQALNLNAIGDTYSEFLEAANEATDLLLEDLLREGELEAFLHQQGWRPARPLPSAGARVRFDVNFDVRKQAHAEDLVPA